MMVLVPNKLLNVFTWVYLYAFVVCVCYMCVCLCVFVCVWSEMKPYAMILLLNFINGKRTDNLYLALEHNVQF